MARGMAMTLRSSRTVGAGAVATRDFGRRRAVMLQMARSRRGQRTFGFFSSVFGLGKKLARTALSSLPVVGPALSTVQRLVSTSRAPLTQPVSSFAPPTKAAGGATAGAGCPAGFKLVNGRCVVAGITGLAQRLIPGGETGLLPTAADEFGEAVVGSFGVPALVPAQVGTIARRDGTVSPILRCPRGSVLGIDELCYNKAVLPVKFRKWAPGPRPPISAADWKAARTFSSVQKKIKKVAGDSGFTCTPKGRGKRK